MASRTEEQTLAWIVLLVQVPGLFAIFNPPPFTDVRGKSHDDTAVADVRRGYAVPTVIALAMGTVVSLIEGSPVPVVIAGVACVSMIASYEWAIHNPHQADADSPTADRSGWSLVR